MKTKKMFECHYSDENSRSFWEAVSSLNEPERSQMYFAGVLLQNMEGNILSRFNSILSKIDPPTPKETVEQVWARMPDLSDDCWADTSDYDMINKLKDWQEDLKKARG